MFEAKLRQMRDTMRKQIVVTIISVLFLFALTPVSFAGSTKCSDLESNVVEIPIGSSVEFERNLYTYGGVNSSETHFLIAVSYNGKLQNTVGMISFPFPDKETRVYTIGPDIRNLKFQVIMVNKWFIRIRVLCSK